MTKISLNQFPYYDDYNEKDNYYQILFKPGKAVQARELTQLQSILQKQIERLGSHIFKDGSQVLPATENGVRYTANNGFFKLAESENSLTHTNAAIENNWLNKVVRNQAGVEAKVIGYRPVDVLGEVRLFVSYTKASTDGLTLVFYPNDTISVVDSTPALAATIPGAILPDKTIQKKTGSIASVTVEEGVYFYSGFFVYVEKQTIFVTPSINPDSVENQNLWDNKPTASIGLSMTQSFITSEEDPNLLDVALGAPNYSAPGADRLHIDAKLEQKLIRLDETKQDQNFIELVSVSAGEVTYKVITAAYGPIESTLARRTYDESGDYTVTPFAVSVREFLREGNNNGVHDETEFYAYTINEAEALAKSKFNLNKSDVPSGFKTYCKHPTLTSPQVYLPGSTYDGTELTSFKNLCRSYISARIDPGKAYVKGYEIQKLARATVDIPKAQSVTYKTNQTCFTPLGTHIVVTDVNGSIDFTTHQTVELYDAPYNTSTRQVAGTKIGTAKMLFVDFFEGVSGTTNSGKYRLYLYDINLDDNKDLEKVKSFRAASTSNAATDFYANAVLSQLSLSGSVSRTPQNSSDAPAANTLYGTGTKWKNDAVEKLTVGDLIQVGNVLYQVTEEPTSDTILKVTPNPQSTSSAIEQAKTWTNGSSFTYMFALPQSNSSESAIVYKLPDQYIASIRDGGDAPLSSPLTKTNYSASYTVPRVFSAQQVANNKITLSSVLSTDETFSAFSNNYVVINETTGNWLRVISGSSQPADANTAAIQQGATNLTVWVNQDNSAPPTKYTVIAPVVIAKAKERSKTLQAATFDATTNIYKSTFTVSNNGTPVTSGGDGGGVVIVDGNVSSEISLHMEDVLRITRVIEQTLSGQEPSGKNTLQNGERDITANYILDDGQRDYYYDIAKVTLRPGVSRPTGRVRVEFDYFKHTNDGGRFFSVDSYKVRGTKANMSYDEIPTYVASDGTAYNLANCIDFRKKITDSVERISIDNFTCNYYTFLGRKDKIILNSKTKSFELSQGTPAFNPLPADENADGMTICELTLQPYTYSSKAVSIRPIENRRYTMRDIEKLENRIKNLEHYTSLTLLEVETATLNITNANGDTRFKNGFLADNFGSFDVCDLGSLDFRCAVDTSDKTVRPLIHTSAVSLYESAIDEASPDTYRSTKTSGPYKKTGDLFTLPYSASIFIRQGLASKTINVNPFNVQSFVGDVTLSPWSDEWHETNLLPEIKVQDSSGFDAAMAMVGPTGTSINYNTTVNNWTGPGPQSAYEPTGREVLKVAGHDVLSKLYPGRKKKDWPAMVTVPQPYANAGQRVPTGRSSYVSQQLRSTTTITGNEIRMGLETKVKDLGWSAEQRALTLINSSQIQWMRSREIEFEGNCFMPNAALYAFFDDVAVSEDCRPTPADGWVDFTVTASENTVSIHSSSTNQTFNSAVGGNTFNIRAGAELVYQNRKFEVVQVVNAGTLKVSPKNTAEMTQDALTSTNPITVRITKYTYGDPLKADVRGNTKGVFKIPSKESKKFQTGDAIFRLTTSSVNAKFPNPLAQNTSIGDARFASTGWLDTQQYTVSQTRMFEVTSNLVATTGAPINAATGEVYSESIPERRDPIAQTFKIREDGGCFITAIDVFFFTKPSSIGINPDLPITLELRSVRDGMPIEVLPAGKLGVVTKQARDVVTNFVDLSLKTLTVTGNVGGKVPENNPEAYVWDATTTLKSENLEKGATSNQIVSGTPFRSTDMALDMVPTRFTFASPIFLEQNKDYSFVLLSDSNEYEVWVAQIGQDNDKNPKFNAKSGLPNYKIGTDEQIGTQVYQDGNFYKSHNASGWAIDNTITCKFNLHKALFDISKTAEIDFVNQELFDRGIFTDGIEVVANSPFFRVVLPNHGLSKGDKVRISNITTPIDSGTTAAPKIKGILKTVFDDLVVTRTEIDHAIVACADTTRRASTGYFATSTGRLGGSTATITDNRRFEDITIITNPFAPPTTSVEWKMVTTASSGINNGELVKTKQPFINFTPNERVFFDDSMRINARLNEDLADTTKAGFNLTKKSLIVTAILGSSNPNLSPVLDQSRFTAALTLNRLDAPVGSGQTAQNINDEFDILNVLTASDDAGGKVHFSTSTGELSGTFSSVGSIVTNDLENPPQDLRSRLNPGTLVFDPSSGQTVRVVEVLSANSFRTEVAFNPQLTNATVVANPENLVIKTDNLQLAQKLSLLDVGKLVTIAGATDITDEGTIVARRNCEDVRVLKVEYTPSNTTPDSDLKDSSNVSQPCYCKVTLDIQTNVGAGREANDFTLTQKDRFIDEIAPQGGSCSAKYVCKKLVVSRVSNALKVTFDASRDESCNLELYYRLEKPNSTTSIEDELWVRAPFNVDINGVLQNKTPDPDPTGTVYSSYESTIEGLLGFVGVQCKIVMKGGNAAKCPKIKNFRMIVLDE